MNQEDHDTILTVASDVRHIVEWTKVHTKDDDNRHEDNLKKFEKIDANQNLNNRIVYGLIGVFVFLEFASKFIKS